MHLFKCSPRFSASDPTTWEHMDWGILSSFPVILFRSSKTCLATATHLEIWESYPHHEFHRPSSQQETIEPSSSYGAIYLSSPNTTPGIFPAVSENAAENVTFSSHSGGQFCVRSAAHSLFHGYSARSLHLNHHLNAGPCPIWSWRNSVCC